MTIVYDLDKIFDNYELGHYRRYRKPNNGVLFTKLEDVWKAIECWYEPFLNHSMEQRHPKIYIDTQGIIVDCYDDKDFITESYSIKIIKRMVV